MFRKDKSTDTESRMKLHHYLTPYTEINSRGIRLETIEHIENIGAKLHGRKATGV